MIREYRSEMVELTRQARSVPRVIVQCMIFILVFTCAQGLASFALFVPLFRAMWNSSTYWKLVYGAVDGIGLDYEGLMNLTSELMGDPVVMSVMLFSTLGTVGAVLFYCFVIQKRSWASLGMRWNGKAVAHYGVGMLMATGFLGAILLLMAAFGQVGGVRYNGFSAWIILFFFGYLIQSFSEELLCRGYFMNSVAAKAGLPLGIWLNSVLFALLHVLNPGMSLFGLVDIMLYGLIFSLLALYTDDIWAASGMHFFWNFALGCLVGSEVSGMAHPSIFTVELTGVELLTGGAFGLEGSLLSIIVGGAIALVLFALLRKKQKASGVTGSLPLNARVAEAAAEAPVDE